MLPLELVIYYIMTACLSDRDLTLARENPVRRSIVHDRRFAIESFPQTALHAKHLTTAPLIDDSELSLTLWPSLLYSNVNRGTRIVTLQEFSKAVVAAYIETIRGTNPSPTFDVWAHNLSSQKSLAQWVGNLLSATALALPCVASLEND